MKLQTYILLLLSILAFNACEDDFETGISSEGLTEGMITIRLEQEKGDDIMTRADAGEDSAIENVLLLLFDENGQLTNKAYQELIEDNNSVSIYMTAVEGQTLYALCNVPEDADVLDATVEGNYTLAQLQGEYITIKDPEGAYTGKYVMSGDTPIELESSMLKKEYTVKVKRLAAKLDFDIQFVQTADNRGDIFLIHAVYMHNIPMGSKLLEASHFLDDGTPDILNVCKEDYTYAEQTGDRKNKYYKGDSLRIDYTESAEGYNASFQMFENRQGGLCENDDNWSRLNGLKNEEATIDAYKTLYEQYQQIEKRGLALNFSRENNNKYTTDKNIKGFPYATYLSIHGVYQKANGQTSNVIYYVYLGEDNYKDFNICRNNHYTYLIRIYDVDKTDTRVIASLMDDLAVYGNFEDILDAHPNVTQALLYSANPWKVRVANPDETPWLEVSTSARYIPNIAGQHKADAATFTLEGNGGLQYFYIHTDEFVPYQEKPGEILSPQANYPDSNSPYRTGKIICESGDVKEEIEIKQYAAQQVVCHIKYDIHTMKEIRDTFYVERVLEQKNLSWGFDHYWSLITDDLIAAGQWDGLANTRRLYEAATQGDKYDIESAYPDGIPSDIALGYAINKNRDRNGDGKITYDEIVWYLPAANEMQAVYGHNKVSLEDAGDYYMDAENIGKIVLDPDVTGNFHTSSPSVADPAGITPGRSYYVDMSSGKKAIGLRSRRYNVLCARRKPGFFGNPNENTGIGGSVGNNPNWNEDEEQIMDKNN